MSYTSDFKILLFEENYFDRFYFPSNLIFLYRKVKEKYQKVFK